MGCNNVNAVIAYARQSGFSTLYGSKWVATYGISRRQVRAFVFQYPLRVEVGCNAGSPPSGWELISFQYPLRVEVGCNVTFLLRLKKLFVFQYPLRVEVGCNPRSFYGYDVQHRVSVPSTGRSGLQRIAPKNALEACF